MEIIWKVIFFNPILRIHILSISYKIGLMWKPRDFIDDNLTLVQVFAWCGQAPSHYMSQC